MAEEVEEDATPKFPSMQRFCADEPLYHQYPLNDLAALDIYNFLTESKSIDLYCVECGQQSIFRCSNVSIGNSPNNFDFSDRVVMRDFSCTRQPSHKSYFYFQIYKRNFHKIGQWPSMADLAEGELLKYRKILDDSDHRELVRAVGLASHGVGIGSFAYLRRIFERLISEARNVAANTDGWSQETYEVGRMEEKIQMLRDYLPEHLVENRALYGVLSKGIHELSEDECLKYFPIVRLGIELILDQKVAQRNEQDKIAKAKKGISDLKQKFK